jgi:hypothetical protein
MKPAIVETVLAAVLLSGGCAVEEGVDGGNSEATGQAQQAVSALGYWSWGCTSSCGLPLGTATDKQQTCFLAGVVGNLQPAGSYSETMVVATGGHWELDIATNGRPLGADVVCVPGAPVATGVWQSGANEVSLGSGATRRCFLSGVRNTSGLTEWTDYVQVRQVRGTWYLGGNMTAAKDILATAVCVDVPTASPDYGLVVSDGWPSTGNLIQDNHAGGWACGIKKLGGHFTTNDWNDGVWIDYNNGITGWELNAVNGKQAATGCVK